MGIRPRLAEARPCVTMDWELVKQLFGAALDLPASERDEFLIRETSGDESTLEAVRELLAADSDPRFLTPKEEATPKRLGSIDIGEEVGRGGMGVVYRGYDPDLQRDVAVKCLSAHLTLSPEQVERFMREARAVAKLQHHGIVTIHGVGEEQGHHFFTMDYLPGPVLESELQNLREGEAPERLPAFDSPDYLEAVSELCARVAEALQYAHERRVVHRDIKPGNLIFGANGHPVVVDFGLARDETLGKLTRSEAVLGTLHYMSPEQARVSKSPTVDHRTDIYSLGVVLYELLTLQRPFNGKSNNEVFQEIAFREPQPIRQLNPRVPRDLATVCQVAMSKRADERYQTAGGFAEDLRRFLVGRPTLARRPAWPIRAWRRVHQRRVAVALFSVAALAVWAGAAYRNRVHASKSRPLVSIEVRDRLDTPLAGVRGKVFVRPVDPITGQVGERRFLGDLPFRTQRLDPGPSRIVVVFESGGFSELFRQLAPDGSPVHLICYHPEPNDGSEGRMALIESCTWSTDDGELSLCPNRKRPVRLDSYYIDRQEVSNAEYREFVLATGHALPLYWADREWRTFGSTVITREGQRKAWDDLPVVGISWKDARTFAEWSGRRLVTHAEWERAARGPRGNLYPWGNDLASTGLGGNVHGAPNKWSTREEAASVYIDNVVAVGSDPGGETPWGGKHFIGNVLEFTETIIVADVLQRPRPDAMHRYAMGRGWYAASDNTARNLTVHGNVGIDPESIQNVHGIRCARSVSP